MELAVRRGPDRFVPPGAYRALETALRRRSAELAEVPAVVLSAFDRSTRLLPFILYDSWMFPAGARPSPAPCTRRASPAPGRSSSFGIRIFGPAGRG